MTAKMTPGPYQALGRKIFGGDGSTVAEVYDYDTPRGEANREAIACLPELVEAARAVADFPPTRRTLDNLRRILARIDGEEA